MLITTKKKVIDTHLNIWHTEEIECQLSECRVPIKYILLNIHLSFYGSAGNRLNTSHRLDVFHSLL